MNPLWEQIIEQPAALAMGVVLIVLAAGLLVKLRGLGRQLASEQARRQELEQELSRHQHDNELQRQRLEQSRDRADELARRSVELEQRGEHWRGEAASLQPPGGHPGSREAVINRPCQ